MGFFNSKDKKTRPESGKTIIASGCKVTGEFLDIKGPLHIDGRIDGVIETDYDVSIGESGYVTGLVKANSIVVSGVLEGKVACQTIDVLSTGKLLGEIIAGEMMIEAGGRFVGQSREMTEGGLVVSFPREKLIHPKAELVEATTASIVHEELEEIEIEDASEMAVENVASPEQDAELDHEKHDSKSKKTKGSDRASNVRKG